MCFSTKVLTYDIDSLNDFATNIRGAPSTNMA